MRQKCGFAGNYNTLRRRRRVKIHTNFLIFGGRQCYILGLPHRGCRVSEPDKIPQTNVLAALGLVGAVGLAIVFPIAAGVGAGVYLEDRLGARGLFLIGSTLTGTGAGFYAAYALITRGLSWKR